MKEIYENMTVKELREESKKRGLTLEHKGHKFTKSELITRLKQMDDVNADIQKSIEEAGQETENTNIETKQNNTAELDIVSISEKYRNRPKKERDKMFDLMYVGSRVVYIDRVKALDGNCYDKMRISAVIGINRKRRIVIVCTSWGKMMNVHFDDILHVKNENEKYPDDIFSYMDKQRMENMERENAKKRKGYYHERVRHFTN